jgi:hypothetical protein
VMRLQALKSRQTRLLREVPGGTSLACIGSAEHRALAETILERSAQQAVEGHLYGG